MDKWKDVELEKMKIGGNRNAREFFDGQDDYDDTMSIQQKYNTKAAALYRDKVFTLASGKAWNAAISPAQKHVASAIGPATGGSYHVQQKGGGTVACDSSEAANYQNMINTASFRDQKDQYFNRVQEQNASRPEWVAFR